MLLLATAVGALSLVGCGQKGGLTLPNNDPDFRQRATLPEIIKRQLPNPLGAAQPAAVPASAASAAASAPTSTPPIAQPASSPASSNQ